MSGARERLTAAVEEAMDAAYYFSNYRWPQQEDCPRIAEILLPVVQALVAEGEKRGRAEAVEESRQFCARSGGCIS